VRIITFELVQFVQKVFVDIVNFAVNSSSFEKDGGKSDVQVEQDGVDASFADKFSPAGNDFVILRFLEKCAVYE
jgi:hypothetical protein